MKASMKFREEQKPLFRAKVPLNILGFPFQSGIVAGESKELSLNLTTSFESGPSLKIAYRPNHSSDPFTLAFKTGVGHFGSPISSSLNMSAEFNLLRGAHNPTFFLRFKPQFGDFSIKKTQSSVFRKQINGGRAAADEDAPVVVDLLDSGKKFSDSPVVSPAAGIVNAVFSDVDLTATTAVPLRKNATLNFRWGLRLPATEDTAAMLMKNNYKSTAEISIQRLPVLLINKIGIEHVARDDCRRPSKVGPVTSDVADVILGVKKQMEIVQAENGALRNAMDALKCEFSAVKSRANAVKGKVDNNKEVVSAHFGGKAMEGELMNGE